MHSQPGSDHLPLPFESASLGLLSDTSGHLAGVTPLVTERTDIADGPRSWPVRAFRVLTSPAALLQATGFLVLVAIGIGAAWLLPPSNAFGDLPPDDAVGTLSAVSVKANRDYTIPDADATEALRNEAASHVRAVYDLDVSAADKTVARVAGAFSDARDALAEAKTQQAQKRGSGRKASADDTTSLASQQFYGEFIKQLQAVVDDAEYRELARQGFSEALEHAVTVIVGGVLAGEVAPSRELLSVERGNGITLRRMGAPTAHGEREIRDIERIPDVAAVRLDLIRLAQGMPELPGSTSGVFRTALGLSQSLDPATRRTAVLLAARIIAPNISYNPDETLYRQGAASAAVKPVVLQYARGEKILGEGERIEKRHLLVFHWMRDQARAVDSVQVRSGATIFTIMLVVAAFSLARRTVRRFRPSKRDLVFLAAALLGNLAALRGGLAAIEQLRDRPAWMTNELVSLMLPLVGGTILVRMLRSGESAVVFSLVFAPLASLLLNSHVPAAVALVASLVAANRLGGRGGRSALPVAAFEAGLAAAIAVTAIDLFGGRALLPENLGDFTANLRELLRLAGAAAFGAGIVSPLLAVLVAPLVELLFGYVSESRLARLANLNNSVLKDLIIKAPGTYHHSLIVGSLAEAAAQRIGAHTLLARVGGYYHDLGKIDAPIMYGENQKGENRLEKMPPEEAAAIMRRHVTDGVARAQAAHLPRAITDFITQHHGTGQAGRFLGPSTAPDGDRTGPMRYDGPRPRSREVALVMLADVVESATRSLADPTPERLHAATARLIQDVMLQGQLDDCDLTLSEIRQVTEAFQEALVDLRTLSRIDVLPGGRPPAPTQTSTGSGEPSNLIALR